MDWLDLLAVQGTLKSLLQHHSSKASILQYSAFFMVQLSHPYTTTGKITASTRGTFVGKAGIFSGTVVFMERSVRPKCRPHTRLPGPGVQTWKDGRGPLPGKARLPAAADGISRAAAGPPLTSRADGAGLPSEMLGPLAWTSRKRRL